MTFADRVKAEMKYHEMTREKLAKKSGVEKCTIDGYLNIRGQLPRVDNAVAIAIALGTTVEYLFLGENIEKEKIKKEVELKRQFNLKLANEELEYHKSDIERRHGVKL